MIIAAKAPLPFLVGCTSSDITKTIKFAVKVLLKPQKVQRNSFRLAKLIFNGKSGVWLVNYVIFSACMKRFTQHPFFVPVSLLCLILCLYASTFNLGYFSDDFQGIERYQRMGFQGLIGNYENAFFMPFSFWFQAAEIYISEAYSFVKTLNIILFWLCAYLLYRITERLFKGYSSGENMARIAALIFICSPYQTEAVNWFSSQAYLLASVFSLWALWIVLREKQNVRTPYYFSLLFLLALLNKEIALVMPFIALLLIVALPKQDRAGKGWILGSVIAFVLYFALRYFVLGSWVGGYGSAVHLNLSPTALFSGLAAYCAKFFGFYRYLTPESRKLFAVGIVLLLAGMAYFFNYRKRNQSMALLPIMSLGAFLISLLPVVNLETSFLENIQSDRYGFFPSLFFSLFFASCIASAPKLLRWGVAGIWISTSYLFLMQSQSVWLQASTVRNTFIQSLQAISEDEIIVLNVPDNLDGVYLFRHGLKEALKEGPEVAIVTFQPLITQKGKITATEWNAATISLNSLTPFSVEETYREHVKKLKRAQFMLFPSPRIFEEKTVYYFNASTGNIIKLPRPSSYNFP